MHSKYHKNTNKVELCNDEQENIIFFFKKHKNENDKHIYN
jgi:hypothetical protein